MNPWGLYIRGPMLGPYATGFHFLLSHTHTHTHRAKREGTLDGIWGYDWEVFGQVFRKVFRVNITYKKL